MPLYAPACLCSVKPYMVKQIQIWKKEIGSIKCIEAKLDATSVRVPNSLACHWQRPVCCDCHWRVLVDSRRRPPTIPSAHPEPPRSLASAVSAVLNPHV